MRIAEDCKCDGLKGYVTNTDLDAEQVVDQYHGLWGGGSSLPHPNIIQELEREFMGYAEELKVLPPVALACTMRNKFLENANLFQ